MNLNLSLKTLEAQARDTKLKTQLALAMQKTDCEIKNIDWLISDIVSEFGNKKTIDILEAIKQGSIGKFGISFKLTTQVVGYWINQYLKEKYKTNHDRL